ncbi:hypothetical protein EAH72_17410 [Pseudomonas caspiana]|nr:anti-virulence regulator CigR family protein [Pseudomonas caspiana]TPG94701.1 hypothetical protein EAH72_17410 [Pseudomonas caspiana]
MLKFRPLVAAFTVLTLSTSAPILLADPGNGKGNPHSNQGQPGNSSKKGNPNVGNTKPGKGSYGADGWDRGPTIDLGGVRVILGDNRQYWGNASPLPPGIQKNLARGKPLPPGIAKKLDGRLAGRLPRYDGYEWYQAGTDVILAAVATGIIYQVLHDALD